MIFIYDILLNFNNDLYEFYEWNKNDIILHIKRIPLIKVNTELIYDLVNKKIKINDSLLNLIYNKTELFNRKNKYIKYSCLLSDGYKVIGILMSDNGEVMKISDLLLDESIETINISNKCNLVNIAYNIIDNKNVDNFLTRKELCIKKYLLKEFNNIYKENNFNKLKYLYFEYFNKTSDDIDIVYEDLIKSLTDINSNHIRIYNLLNMTSNLTN